MMADLALVSRSHWTWRFTIMLSLSVLVAVMGLLAGSAAVVIGAMLLAPLMTPVLGTAAAIAMGLPRKTFTSLMRVILASAWAIALAYLASKVTFTSATSLSAEIESRTRPDIRDLIVALAAGAAGSYATVRSDTSSSLPGVAVAVALVPPLATVGVTLEAGNEVWARGAFLLYLTNLAAIVFVSILVFLATGFVPPRRVVTTVPRILGGLAIAVVAVAAISVPLLRASQSAAEDSLRERDAREAIEGWIGDLPIEIESFDLDRDPVVVRVSGPVEPPPIADLEERLRIALDEDLEAAVFIDETREPTTTTTVVITDDERLLTAAEEIVLAWLAANDDGNAYELNALAIVGQELELTVSGLGEAPPIEDLIVRLDALDGDVVSPSLRWSQLEEVPIGEPPPTPGEVAFAELRVIVGSWARTFDLLVQDVEFEGGVLAVDVEGAEAAPIEPLLAAVEASDVDVVDTQVFFTQRVRLETTTTTTTTTTTEVDGEPGQPAQSEGTDGQLTTTSSTTTTTGG